MEKALVLQMKKGILTVLYEKKLITEEEFRVLSASFRGKNEVKDREHP